MKENRIYCQDWTTNELPDKSVQLIIADPPYFEVKGSFDFVWKSFDDYLKDVEKWAIECKRLLADNGTLFWYGHAKRIAYAQIIFDKHFNLINNLVWNKGSFMGLEESEGLRSFAPCTERILMYGSNVHDTTGLEFIKDEYWGEMSPFSKIILDHINNKGFTQKDISLLQLSRNGKPTGWVSNKIKFGQLPTAEQWQLICSLFKIENKYEELRKDYEELRKDYEELRRPFENIFKLQEIINYGNEATKTGAKYDHDTCKPEKLTRALILTCSRKNDLVLVPFVGSGTECAMSAKEKRRFIGFDIEQKYVDMANDRCRQHLEQQTLF
jgi:site-specific DNA-methyltransferase (adenine-specific)